MALSPAILAAAGVAIGMAWSGLLANFAAGAFMIVLRPFKVGDFVTAAGLKDGRANDDPTKNKTLAGLYPPGSTVKPMVALALALLVIATVVHLVRRGEA